MKRRDIRKWMERLWLADYYVNVEETVAEENINGEMVEESEYVAAAHISSATTDMIALGATVSEALENLCARLGLL